MILKFIQAETMQPVLIMTGAIAAVAPHPLPGVAFVLTNSGISYSVLGTVEQIEATIVAGTSITSVAIAPVGG